MTIIYTLLGVPYVAVLDPVRGVVLQKAARKRKLSPGQMSLFAGNDPKEGDTKVENGVTYRLNQNSRWERTDKAKGTAKAKPKAVVPVVEEKAESKAKAKSKPSGVADMRQKGDTGSRRDEKPAMQTQHFSSYDEVKAGLFERISFPVRINKNRNETFSIYPHPRGADKYWSQTELLELANVLRSVGVNPPRLEKSWDDYIEKIKAGPNKGGYIPHNDGFTYMSLGQPPTPAASQDEVKPMPNFEVVSDRKSQPPGTIFYDDPGVTPEQRAWMEYGGQNYIPATIASRTEIDNTFPDVAQAAAKARKYGYQGADDYEVLARYMAGGAARNVGSQNVYPVYFEDEPTPVAAEVVVDEPKPKQRLGDRMRAIAQELRQETEAQKQYTARMLGAAAQLAQNQDNLIDEVVDMVNEDLDTPEALPEPTIGDMLAEQKAEEEAGGMAGEDAPVEAGEEAEEMAGENKIPATYEETQNSDLTWEDIPALYENGHIDQIAWILDQPSLSLPFYAASRMLSILGFKDAKKKQILNKRYKEEFFKKYPNSPGPSDWHGGFDIYMLRDAIESEGSLSKQRSQKAAKAQKALKDAREAFKADRHTGVQAYLLHLEQKRKSLINESSDMYDDAERMNRIWADARESGEIKGGQRHWVDALSARGQGPVGTRQRAHKRRLEAQEIKQEIEKIAQNPSFYENRYMHLASPIYTSDPTP